MKVKKDNNGFTLIEILGILVILTIVGLLVFKVIDSNLKKNKEVAYEKQLKMIELSAKNYMSENMDELPVDLNSTSVTLQMLKVNGFADMVIINPKTNQCFDNGLTIKITGLDGQYTYEIIEDTIKDGICDELTFEKHEPNPGDDFSDNISVAIGGWREYVSTGETLDYTITYNVSVTDEQVKKNIGYIVESSSGSTSDLGSNELTIGEELEEANGYSRRVSLLYTKKSDDDAGVYLYLKEGFITIGNKKSDYIITDKTKTANKAPQIEVVIPTDTPSLTTVTETFIVSGTEVRQSSFLTDNNNAIFYNVYDCPSGALGHSFGVKVKSDQTVNYKLSVSSSEMSAPIKKAVEAETEVIAAFKYPSAYNAIEACNYNGSCTTLEVTYNKEDCAGPVLKDGSNDSTISIKDSSTTTIGDIFKDQVSGISSVYAFIYPYTYEEFSNEYNRIRNLSVSVGVSINPGHSNFLNYYDLKGYVDLLGGYVIGEYTERDTISKIKSDMNKMALFCGNNNSLYFLAVDKSFLPNINFYATDYTINNSGYLCESNTNPSSKPGVDSSCDAVCKMKQNSLKWWQTNSLEERQKLNQENFNLCYSAYEDKCYYDSDQGSWYYCETGSSSCTNLYSGIDSPSITSTSFGLVPATNVCLISKDC